MEKACWVEEVDMGFLAGNKVDEVYVCKVWRPRVEDGEMVRQVEGA